MDEEDEDALTVEVFPRRSSSQAFARTWCNTSLTPFDIIFMVSITVVSLGVNFAIDLPASLEDAMSKYYNLNQYDFSLFYTSYYLPSMLLSVFGGYVIDKVIGVKKGTVISCVLAAVGLTVFTYGATLKLFWLMILGRFIFGFGNEMCSSVCLNYCTFNYFGDGGKVNLMFSLSDNLSFVGTVAVFQLTPFLFSYFDDSGSQPYRALNLVIIICSSTYLLTGSLSVFISYMGNLRIASSLQRSVASQSNQISVTSIKSFPPVFWLLCLVYCSFMNAAFTFETFSQGILTSSAYKLSVEEASNAVSIMNVFKICFSVPLSLLVDKSGCNIIFIAISNALSIVSYSLFCLTSIQPYIIMGLLGVSYSMTASSIWAMFAYPISKELRGSCYGIVSAVCGFSQTLSPSIVGDLIDSYGYMAAMYFFLANASAALIFTVLTWAQDCKNGRKLNMAASKRFHNESNIEEEEDLIDQDWFASIPQSTEPP